MTSSSEAGVITLSDIASGLAFGSDSDARFSRTRVSSLVENTVIPSMIVTIERIITNIPTGVFQNLPLFRLFVKN